MSAIARRVAIMHWSPRRFGSGLYTAWDPEERASLDLSGGAVSTWRDYVSSYAPTQALGASRPAYAASPFNGRPICTPDGIDDQLTLAGVPAGIPTGATPFEIWCIWNQTALVADTVAKVAIAWGTAGGTGVAALHRVVVGGVNRALLLVGNGSTSITPTNLNVDLSGRHVIRGVVDGVNARVDVDGIAGAPLAVVPAIGSVRLRLFANSATSVGGFAPGDFSGIFITRLLSSDEAIRMYAFCNRRIV